MTREYCPSISKQNKIISRSAHQVGDDAGCTKATFLPKNPTRSTPRTPRWKVAPVRGARTNWAVADARGFQSIPAPPTQTRQGRTCACKFITFLYYSALIGRAVFFWKFMTLGKIAGKESHNKWTRKAQKMHNPGTHFENTLSKINFGKIHFGNKNLKAVCHSFQKTYDVKHKILAQIECSYGPKIVTFNCLVCSLMFFSALWSVKCIIKNA